MGAANYMTAIVEFLAKNQEPKKLTEIGKALNIGNSTAYRVLTSLNDAQWVAREEGTKKYRIGSHLLEIALLIVSRLDLRNISLPYLERINAKINESVMLSSRIGLERMYIEQIHSDHELRHFVGLGKRLPLWKGAPGKVILAYFNDNEIEMVINQLKAHDTHTLASGQPIKLAQLRKELSEIKKKGFSITSGERIIGTNSVAAPIFDQNHKVVGSLSIGGPMARFSPETAALYAPLVMETANKISIQLGYSKT